MAITDKVKLRIVELKAEGYSYAKIASEVGVAKQTAVDIVKDNRDKVGTLQGIEWESLLEANQINLRGRLTNLSTLWDKLRKEIESRDLSEVPTEKLITLYLKTAEAIKGEAVPIVIRSTDEQAEDLRERTSLGWGV